MSKAKRDPEKEAFWRLVGEEHQRSGLTAREFCRKEGLSEASFHSWKRVLAQRDREARARADNRSTGRASRSGRGQRLAPSNRKKQPSAGSNSFVPVEIVSSPVLPSSELTIRTPAGFTIGVPSTVDVAQLGQVLEVLTSQPSPSKTSVQRDAS